MTTADQYLDLITSFHRDRPRFVATVAASVQPMIDLSAMLARMPADFDIDEAVGVQLDILGEWIGRSRFVPHQLPDNFFRLDDAYRGLDVSIWYDGSTPGYETGELDDDTYRALLKAKILANIWPGDCASAQAALETFFVTTGTLSVVQDDGDMTMIFGIAQVTPSVLRLVVFGHGLIPLKPVGVSARYLVASVDRTPLFGLDIENEKIAGLDVGSWGVSPDSIVELLDLAGAGSIPLPEDVFLELGALL